jgi:hypothetical protein
MSEDQMTKRITLSQISRLAARGNLRVDDDQFISRQMLEDFLRNKGMPVNSNRLEQIDFFTPILDADVPEPYQATLAKYRTLATEHGVPATTPVCYSVRAGFTLKKHAPKLGNCKESFQYLQNWNFSDEPTKDCLVFWVPRVINGSTSKTKDKQIKLLADLRTKLKLPAHHMSGFGSIALAAGLILAHFKATGERIPLNQYWVRTDTCGADGVRLDLGGFDAAGLGCVFLVLRRRCPRRRRCLRPGGGGIQTSALVPRFLGTSLASDVPRSFSPEQIHLLGAAFFLA